jgi:alkanesulfonate monooxygenase SsuD/methylene tetrahydromethanopterin reductase-like flavin-dependent oxidoreductase (luciferase family)
VEFGVHLPLIDFGGNAFTSTSLRGYVRRAAALGFTTVAANDHLVFPGPWLDGLVALASVIADSATMRLATTVGLPVVRGPVPFAKAIAAIDRLSEGRLLVGVGPGSSGRDHELAGLDFEERWKRLDEIVPSLRALWRPGAAPYVGQYYSTAGIELLPAPTQAGGPPIWLASWGSDAGLRRVARLGDGWLASAYNITAAGFAERWDALRAMLAERGREPDGFPNALSTMWFHISDTAREAEEVLSGRLVPVVQRPEDLLRERLPFGSAEVVAERLIALRDAGVKEVFIWPVIDEERQLELFRERVWPLVADVAET